MNFISDNIKKADVKHAEQILAIEKEAFSYPWKIKSRFFQTGQLYTYLRDDEVLGYILFKIKDDTCRIVKIASSNDSRGKGIGKSMLVWLMENMECLGVTKIVLNVRKSNTNAINFYKKNKFTQVREIKEFYSKSTNESSILMIYENQS